MLRLWRFLLECNELILFVLEVLLTEANWFTILLLLMSPTVPDVVKLEFVSRNNVVDKDLLSKVIRTRESLVAERTNIRPFLSMGAHMSLQVL
jgi:hypothetical protein